MTGMRFLEKLKQKLATAPPSSRRGDRPQARRDPEFSSPRSKGIDQLPPERAAELAGHAPERVDT